MLLSIAGAARDPATSPDVAALLEDRLSSIATALAAGGAGQDGAWARHIAALLRDKEALQRTLETRQAAPAIPPGMPIGDTGWFDD
jgi:hypothetical protein